MLGWDHELKFHASPIQCEMQSMCQEGKTLGVSKLRFLPKLTGVRPIMNLQSRMKSTNDLGRTQSVNYHLNAVFHVLKLEMVC